MTSPEEVRNRQANDGPSQGKKALAVFVHGLGADVDLFWGSTIDALGTSTQLTHVDVRPWGYVTDSKPTRRPIQLWRNRRLQTIEQLGQQFWSVLEHWFDSGNYSAVVLFGHSMGGLVLAAAVESGLRDGRNDKLIGSLAGIALCASPLGGADLADKAAPIFRLFGQNVQVSDLRKNSPSRRRLVVRFVNRTVAIDKEDRNHRRIDLLLFRASEDAIVSQAEMTEPFGDSDVPIKVLRGSHSGCVQNLGQPGDLNFEMIVRWIEQRTGGRPPSDGATEPAAPAGTAQAGDNGANASSVEMTARVADAFEPPPIRAAKAADGSRIAFWTMGCGVPLVIPPPGLPFSNVELELENPLTRGWYERLARFCRPVRYDARGSGLSEDEAADFSLNSLVQDVEAVAERLGQEKIALLGGFHGGPIAISYAAAHPERVSHLILWCTYAEASEFWNNAEVRALNDMLSANWWDYTETVAGATFGWEDQQTRGRMAHFLRRSLGQDSARHALAAIEKFDVSDELGRIQAPTLVLHSRGFRFLSQRQATKLASEIPDGILDTIEDGSGSLLAGTSEAESVAQRIQDFLGRPMRASEAQLSSTQ